MIINVGLTDRAIRIAVGIVLIALALIWPRTAWGWLGLLPLVSGLFRVCPFYRALGINTCG